MRLPQARRALVTILEEEPHTGISETALLSEQSLAEDWNSGGAKRGHTSKRSSSFSALSVFRSVGRETASGDSFGGHGTRRLDFVSGYRQPYTDSQAIEIRSGDLASGSFRKTSYAHQKVSANTG